MLRLPKEVQPVDADNPLKGKKKTCNFLIPRRKGTKDWNKRTKIKLQQMDYNMEFQKSNAPLDFFYNNNNKK